MVDQNAYVACLLDFYGVLLTPRQRFLLSEHVNEDFSLTEIAQMEGVSRQSVYDAIHTAQQLLFDYETKLGLVARYFLLRDGTADAYSLLEKGQTELAMARLKQVLELQEETDGF